MTPKDRTLTHLAGVQSFLRTSITTLREIDPPDPALEGISAELTAHVKKRSEAP